MKSLEQILKALANSRRLSIIKYINKHGSATVGEIADEIKLSFKSTSKHLVVLSNAGILDKNQVGLNMLYSLSKPVHQVLKTVLSIL